MKDYEVMVGWIEKYEYSSYVILGWTTYLYSCFDYIYCAYLTLSLCVWLWSDNLLSGSRWRDRWASRCLDSERGLAGDVFEYTYILCFINLALRKSCKPGRSHWLLFQFYEIMDSWFYSLLYIRGLNFPCFGK